jgi:ubiquinone/menaquinone biosynthesis C-methylase UbiE
MVEQADREVEIQRQYYRETAHRYNEMHVDEKDEHSFALSFLIGAIEYLEARSILDIGSGTGRALLYLKQRRPDLQVIGIEPVEELREIGYASGLCRADLVAGDATNLHFDDNQFDIVCEFGVLHHIKMPHEAIGEMLRVAGKAVFISDSNNFGQGSRLARCIKQALNSLGIWKGVDFLKTRGKSFTLSAGDGLAYSYSVFTNYNQVKASCKSVHILNTAPGGISPYRSAGHVALLGIK